MGLLKKLFGGGKKSSQDTDDARGVHMPDPHIPVDEKFTILFKKNGGKFIYCDSMDEVSQALGNIISENQWQDTPFYTLDQRLEEKFSPLGNLSFTSNSHESQVFLTTCEHLIGQNGSILVCSEQLKENKLSQVPDNIVVFATTSQLVESIGEGLKSIKRKYKEKIPTNITTIKHFGSQEEADKDDFMSYGSSSKNLYLILLEDL